MGLQNTTQWHGLIKQFNFICCAAIFVFVIELMAFGKQCVTFLLSNLLSEGRKGNTLVNGVSFTARVKFGWLHCMFLFYSFPVKIAVNYVELTFHSISVFSEKMFIEIADMRGSLCQVLTYIGDTN